MAKQKAPKQGDPDYEVWLIGYNQGLSDGHIKTRGEVIDYLMGEYLKPDISRESIQGKAIMALMEQTAQFMRGELPEATSGKVV
jgi:hypothetical protein